MTAQGSNSSSSSFKTTYAKTTNSDITTDIQKSTSTQLPLIGNVKILDKDYEVSGNGIKCKFTGRIKVTCVFSSRSPDTTVGRATGRLQCAINDTLENVSVTWYNRTIIQADQEANVDGATLIDILDVSENDVISIYNSVVNGEKPIYLDTVGGSMLLIERLE